MYSSILQISKEPISREDYYIEDCEIPNYMDWVETDLTDEQQEDLLDIAFREMEIKDRKLIVGKFSDFKKRYIAECRKLLDNFEADKSSLGTFSYFSRWADQNTIFYLDGHFYTYKDIISSYAEEQFYIGMVAMYHW